MSEVLRQRTLPVLNGSQLVIGTDSSQRHGHWIDSVICTNEEGLFRWRRQQHEIREHFDLGKYELHYNEISQWPRLREALPPSLDAAKSIPGLCLVMCYSPGYTRIGQPEVEAAIQSQSFDLKHERWKTNKLMMYMGLAGLVATVIAHMAKPGQRVLWLNDEEPEFTNAEQRQDILRLTKRALQIHPVPMIGELNVTTSKSEDSFESGFRRDYVALADITAGAIGDVYCDSTYAPHGNYVVGEWKGDRKTWPREMISSWFWSARNAPLVRHAFKVDYNGSETLSVSTLVR